MRTRWMGYILAAAIAVSGAEKIRAQEGSGAPAFARGPMVRGTVTAVTADHFSIKTDEGNTYEIAVTPNTRLMKDRQPVKMTDVKVGDGVGAMGELDASKKTLHALFVAVMDAEQVKKMREGLGKIYITGKVTAIDDVKLTIMRPDHVSQTIEVDETTSFRKAGRRRGGMASPDGGANPTEASGNNEIVTLADVKVGDMIAGQGSVKHGSFVPTNLTILPQGAEGAMGMRMRTGEGTPQSSAVPAPASSKQ
ncbi:DUF5666 domain-containing protein [Edaphobacter albus]|uniref:DUF5666 domain-containing protein n=1 Tax=Edaphobacter sp. 4G125 TaxID=2763071 RepID=UPI0016479B5E|nr:DUF5666 domain-containing protein [Edaphobacter sp. 4G125]QNI37819.1 hypothetical protein H7846_05955 [Edaphobacter sp. 4G125]